MEEGKGGGGGEGGVHAHALHCNTAKPFNLYRPDISLQKMAVLEGNRLLQ